MYLQKGVVPPLSVANGIDFGYYRRIHGLVPPTLHEQMILARSRLFFATVMISSNVTGVVNSNCNNRIKSHGIVFPHDAPDAAAYMYNSDIFGDNGILDIEKLKGLLHILMVDPDGNPDMMFQRIFETTTALARPWAIAQWLLVHKFFHRHYTDINVAHIERVNDVMSELISYMEIDADAVLNTEDITREQTMGADVAQVQHSEV
jgi:hypothetical protein